MDIKTLENFLDYKPVFEDDPIYLLNDIKQKALEYLPKDKVEWIDRAYNFAKMAHSGQFRQSWEPYLIHPLKATLFLMKIRPWLKTIQTCILHDVIEDTEYTYDDVQNEFWKEVADLCDWLVKVSRIRYSWEDRNLETLKKTFLAMWKDLRVIFVKLADRIHNIQTLKYHPKEEKRLRIANETLKIYVPIAQRLWLSVFQNYLENGSFYIMNPKEFNRIFSHIKRKHWEHNLTYIYEWVSKIEEVLNESWVEYIDVKWRLKSPYRVYKKLKKYWTDDPNKIMDILAFRIVTKSISDCYSSLWVINNKYTPLIKRIKDYIALPKVNWYKSLHTTVIGMFNFPVEIQIRDQEMDYFAEFWVAAHFAYKEKWDAATVSAEQASWIKKLQEIVNTFQSADKNDDFKSTIEIEALDKSIFLYTPAWDVIEMPSWSTVLDFAFKIHTDVWLKFKNALVDDKIVPIDYRLKTWSIVEIKTYKKKFTASSWWVKFLHNPSSKSKLNRYVRQNQIQTYINQWASILNNRLKDLSLPLLWDKDDRIASSYTKEKLDNLFIKIFDKQTSPTSIIRKHYDNVKILTDIELNWKAVIKDPNDDKILSCSNRVIIDGHSNLNSTLCPECKPHCPDKIIWKSTRDWIKIHSMNCKALDSISYDKLIETHWEWESYNKYILNLRIKANDRPWMLLNILTILSDFSVNISNIWVEKKLSWYSVILIDLEFENPSKMHFIVKELKNRNELVKVLSKNIK